MTVRGAVFLGIGAMVGAGIFAFGSYATAPFIGDNAGSGWDNVFSSIALLAVIFDFAWKRVRDVSQSSASQVS